MSAKFQIPKPKSQRKGKPNKRVTPRAASFSRIAQEHRSYASSHSFIAQQKDISPNDKRLHRTLAIFHRETASINTAEAKRLRAMR